MSSATLPTRKIGDTLVTAIGFGMMGIAGLSYGAAESDEERFKVLDRVFELGCTNWDTSDIYGDSEELIGKWFKRTGNRSKIFLATKFGFTPTFEISGKPEYVKEACAASLAKLGVDCIDLYYAHRADPTVPIELTVGAMAGLVKEGKVKYLGLSEVSAATIRRAQAVHPISAIQVEYSPLVFDVEKNGAIETAKELGMAVVAYAPLGRGLVTGQYSHADLAPDDGRRGMPKYAESNFPIILRLADQLKSIASKYGANVTPGQVALAWLLAQGDNIIPIPGTKRILYAEENFAALLLKLTPDDVQLVREAVLATEKNLPGDQYSEVFMKMLYVDTPPLSDA